MQSNLLKAIVFAVCGGVCATNMSAFTVEDLTDNSTIALDRLHWAVQDAYGEGEAPLGVSNQIRLEKIPESNNNTGAYYHDRVKLCGLMIHTELHSWLSLDYVLMLLDENDNVVTDGTHLGIAARYTAGYYNNYYDNGDVDKKGYSIVTGYWSDLSQTMGDESYKGYNFRGCSTDFWKGEISRDYNGDIHIDFNDPCVVLPINSSTWVNNYLKGYLVGSNTKYVIDNYHIDIITPNAYLNGKVAKASNTSATAGSFGTPVAHEPYPCKVILDGGKFEVINLTGNGYPITTKDASPNRTRQSVITGGYNSSREMAWIDRNQGVELDPQFNSSYGYRGNLRQMNILPIERSPRAIVPVVDIEGTYTESSELAHRVVKNYWVTDGGQLRTYESYISMTFPDFAYVYALDMVYDGTPVQQFYYGDAYVDNAIDIYEGDVTHELKHEFLAFGHGTIGDGTSDQYLRFVTQVTPDKNPWHVKGYELWLVPGTYTDATHADFLHANGHVKAYLLDGINLDGSKRANVASVGAKAAKKTNTELNDDGSVKFDVIINEDDIPTTSYNRNGTYSVYVKTIYNNNLAPTFHNLISPTEDVVTGIESVLAPVESAEPEYFNLLGIKVANPEAGQIYIERCGNRVTKVVK